ncbi:MAG: AbrB family transcriptional regulator [Hyphomicrobiaceae bacterium]|nr:AbrB family transcriptional regulator [Hyphomicrobiaceae bacterium]
MPAPATWSPLRRWGALAGLSLLLAVGFKLAQLPAAFLLGPMLAAIVLATAGAPVTLERNSVLLAQGAVGMMIAALFPPSTFAEIVRDWPVFLFGTLSTLVASFAIGWLMMRARVMPGTTAIWGSAPGAASVMTFMSAEYGADMRLVALMQYLRVALCTIIATIVARWLGVPSSPASLDLFPHVAWLPCLATCALAVAGVALGIGLKVPGGAMLLPMLLGIAANLAGQFPLTLPPSLLAVAYAVLGWAIGMRFTMDILAHAAAVLPRLLLSVLALLVICGGLGWVLSWIAGVDFLSAYLATNPGGADSLAIISSSTTVDVPFVMAMQLARFLLVMIAGPLMARLLSYTLRDAETRG